MSELDDDETDSTYIDGRQTRYGEDE